MLCPYCGADSSKNVRFCTACGKALPESPIEELENQPPAGNNPIGFSPRINDPAFARYIKNTRRWSYIFASILAVIVIGGFYYYGETSDEMNNPEALYIGLGLGVMFLGIALLQSIGRKRSTTWDGQVVDKQTQKKRRRRQSGDDYYWESYRLYTVFIRRDSGKMETINIENDDTIFNYYKIGDRVRHHGQLNSFEKYDKSKDSIIFCNACASLNDINNDTCFRCHCPLLK